MSNVLKHVLAIKATLKLDGSPDVERKIESTKNVDEALKLLGELGWYLTSSAISRIKELSEKDEKDLLEIISDNKKYLDDSKLNQKIADHVKESLESDGVKAKNAGQ